MKKIIKDNKTGRVRVQTINEEKSLTQQQFKDQVEINNIIARYNKTGQWPEGLDRNSVFADVSEITDYKDSLEKVMKAQDAFGLLPGEIRNRFANDPAKLLEFIQDPRNYAEGVELGIFERKPPVPDANANPNTTIPTTTNPNANATPQTVVTTKP